LPWRPVLKPRAKASPAPALRDARSRRAPGGGRRLVHASFVWAGYWLYNLQLSCAFWFAPWCESPAHVDWPNGSMALGLALVLLSGPVLMLLLGLGIIWAIKGFLSRRAAGS
jgi:hypothetical protein